VGNHLLSCIQDRPMSPEVAPAQQQQQQHGSSSSRQGMIEPEKPMAADNCVDGGMSGGMRGGNTGVRGGDGEATVHVTKEQVLKVLAWALQSNQSILA